MAGAVAIDIGGGTTLCSGFSDGRPKHLGLLSIGGDHITNDVGSVLKLPLNRAEEIKSKFLYSLLLKTRARQSILSTTQKLSVSRMDLHEIIRCRLEELCDTLIRPEIKAAGISMLPAGIILTGGVSDLEGLDALLLDMMDLPARAALPLDANRMPPGRNTQEYSSAAGIIRYVLDKERYPLRYLDNQMIAKSLSDNLSRPIVREGIISIGGKNNSEAPRANAWISWTA